MGVDTGYGSGTSLSANQSVARRSAASRSKAAATRRKGAATVGKQAALSVAKKTPLSKQTKEQWNMLLNAKNKSPLTRANRRLSKKILFGTTGIGVKKNGISVDPLGLAMALPIGKVLKAAKALRAAGNVRKAAALEARVLANRAGQETARFGGTTINDVAMRNQSTSVFPRIGSIKTRTAPNRILEMQGRKRYTDMDRFNDYMSGYPTSKAQARAALRNSNKPRAK